MFLLMPHHGQDTKKEFYCELPLSRSIDWSSDFEYNHCILQCIGMSDHLWVTCLSVCLPAWWFVFLCLPSFVEASLLETISSTCHIYMCVCNMTEFYGPLLIYIIGNPFVFCCIFCLSNSVRFQVLSVLSSPPLSDTHKSILLLDNPYE